MRKEMEEELARSMEQNRQEMMNMETSWQQRLQESEQKIVIVRAHPWGCHFICHTGVTSIWYRGNKRRRRGKKLVRLSLIFGISMKILS